MRQVPIQAGGELDGLLAGHQEGVLLTKDGQVVGMVVPLDDEEAEWATRELQPEFIDSIARARDQVRRGMTTDHKALRAELDAQ